MNNYSKYIILSHLLWSENGISLQELNKIASAHYEECYRGLSDIEKINLILGFQVPSKDIISLEDYQNIKFLTFKFSNKIIDLSFVKYCSNLEEVYVTNFELRDLDAFKENKKLKYITASSNKITNIEALFNHDNLEALFLEYNPAISFKPIVHLKNINELKVGLVDDESHILNFVKFHKNCKVEYFIEGGPLDFEKFIFNYYRVYIMKCESHIEIDIEAIKDASEPYYDLKIPEHLINNIAYSERLLDNLLDDLAFRLEIILDRKISIDLQTIYSFGNIYHLNCRFLL